MGSAGGQKGPGSNAPAELQAQMALMQARVSFYKQENRLLEKHH